MAHDGSNEKTPSAWKFECQLSRRQFFRTTAVSGIVAAFAGLLAACGGSSSKPATSASSSSSSSATKCAVSSTGSSSAESVSASPPGGEGKPKPGGTLVYALTNEYDTLDPSVTTFTDVGIIAFHIFDPLVWSPAAGKFIPGLSEKWEVTPTADQYTFHLRSDVKFHDGTPFNADAVKFTFDRIVNPELKSQSAFSLIGPYDGTMVTDHQTAVVKFKKPYAPFLASCAQSVMAPVSPTAVKKYGKDFGVHPVGTGPFKFSTYNTNNLVGTIKNPDYNWAPSMFKHQGPAYLDGITWRVITEPGTRLAALQSGEVQFIENLPTQNYKGLQNSSTIEILQGLSAGSPNSMMINVTRPPTTDVSVRQALEWGVDKAGMIKVVWQGIFTPAASVLTDNMFGYDPATKNVYHYDPKKAGDVLDADGWKAGSGGVRQKNGQKLILNLYYQSDNAVSTAMATYLKSQYQQIGIQIDLHGLSQAGYFDAVRAGKHNLQFWVESATDPDVVRVLLYSANAGGGTNRNNYKSPEMDKLIDEGAGTTDPAKRIQFYAQIQMMVLQQAIMVPFAGQINLFAYSKAKVHDPMLDWAANFPLFYDAWLT